MTVNANKVYRDGSKLVRPTGESPRQFAGVLFAVYEGDSPETVEESVRTVDQLRGLQEVEVSTLSVQWKKALGLPEVEPTPNRQDTPRSRGVMARENGVTPEQLRRKQRRQRRTKPGIQVVETRYVTVNPRFGWFALNFYLGLLIFVTLFAGVNKPFIAMMILLSLVAVAYAWAATFVKGKVRHETPTTRRYI